MLQSMLLNLKCSRRGAGGRCSSAASLSSTSGTDAASDINHFSRRRRRRRRGRSRRSAKTAKCRRRFLHAGQRSLVNGRGDPSDAATTSAGVDDRRGQGSGRRHRGERRRGVVVIRGRGRTRATEEAKIPFAGAAAETGTPGASGAADAASIHAALLDRVVRLGKSFGAA